MLNKNIAALLNEQVNAELYSAYLYLSFADYYEEDGLDGFASWFVVQAREELSHAMLIRKYLHNNGEKVTLSAIKKSDLRLQDRKDALAMALKHECYVTELIHKIYSAAIEEKDYRTMQFLDWFIAEQGEEEKSAEDLIRKYQLFGTDAKGLYALNQELRQREYEAPGLSI